MNNTQNQNIYNNSNQLGFKYEERDKTRKPEKLFKQGIKYQHGIKVTEDIGRASALFELAADKGHALAMNSLYEITRTYLDSGNYQDVKRGIAIHQHLADKGYSTSIYELSILYNSGKGVPKDHEKSFSLLQQAAEKLYIPALMQLGTHYQQIGMDIAIETHEGNTHEGDVELISLAQQNFRHAVNNFHIAANMGNAEAMFNLAIFYEHGGGVEEDKAKYMSFLNQAARNGSSNARQLLEMEKMYAVGNF